MTTYDLVNRFWRCKGRPPVPFGPPAESWPPVIGTYTPGPTTTGVRPGVTLTRYDGDIVAKTPGQVIEALDIYGSVKVLASGVRLRNCVIRGPQVTPTTDIRIVDAVSSSAYDFVMESCEVVPNHPSLYVTGIYGHDMTVRYTYVHESVDGFGLMAGSGPCVLEGNWVSDLAWFSPDPTHADNHSHNDDIQIFGGTGHIIRGNRLASWLSKATGTLSASAVTSPTGGQALSCILANAAGISGLVVEDNWCEGAGIPFSFLGANLPTGNVGTFNRNHFDGLSQYQSPTPAQTIALRSGVTGTFGTGADANTFPDGTPVLVRTV